ncbi:hypothetical protein TDB9533_00610 [Thalassocella blandensis]|nr:hypothetical protein TDB9533_00610 [Thalassocella blandensis]
MPPITLTKQIEDIVLGNSISNLHRSSNLSQKIDSSYKKHPKKWNNAICYGHANQAFRKDSKLPSKQKEAIGKIVDAGYGDKYSKLMGIKNHQQKHFNPNNIQESGFVSFINNRQSRNDGVFHTGYIQRDGNQVHLYHANANDLDIALIGKDALKTAGPLATYTLSDPTKADSLNLWLAKNDYSFTHTPNSQLTRNL